MKQISDIHLVMHATAVKKGGEQGELAALTLLSDSRFSLALERAKESGKITEVDGQYFLSAVGHMIVGAEYSRYYDKVRQSHNFMVNYAKFEAINVDLKSIITSWQMVEVAGASIVNDHSDKTYDSEVIDRLGDLNERFGSILSKMIELIPRFKFYQEKLLIALELAEDGEVQWVSDAKIESYHTVWFEMHEDILRVLGRERQE